MKGFVQFACVFFAPVAFLAYCYGLYKALMWMFDFASNATGIGLTLSIVLVQVIAVFSATPVTHEE